jgi:putative cell wall-binding protein
VTRTTRTLAALAAAVLALGTLGAPALAVSTPPNDDLATATAAVDLPFYDRPDTTGATAEPADAEAAALCGSPTTLATLWYTLTAPESRAFQVDVSHTPFGMGVIVVTGSPGSFSLVACRQDSVSFDATAGETYSILIYSRAAPNPYPLVAIGFAPPWIEDVTQDSFGSMFCAQRSTFSACYQGAAQTVTATTTGRLVAVVLPMARASFTTVDLSIEIRADGPTGDLLATSDPVPASAIPVGAIDGTPTSGAWVPFYFPAPPTLVAGDTFAIVLPSLPVSEAPDPAWGWGKAGSDVYAGGVAYGGAVVGGVRWDAWWDGSDFAFDTIVEPLDWPTVVRYWGSSRFGTAADISFNTFAPDVDVAYIAYAYNFPDALAGAAAAGTVKGPVLLANTTGSLDPVTAAELAGLDPKRIVVLGGTGVISDAVKTALQAYTAGTVTRLAGSSRFGTAAAISAATFGPGVDVAYIAYAYNFPDALAGAAAAGTVKGPVLLANTTGPLDPATAAELTRLQPKRIVVLGGTGVISDAVKTALQAYTAGTVTRLAGSSRFGTAAAISAATFAPGVDVAYVAYAYNFPDALAGAAAAGTVQGPVLLVNKTGPLDAATIAELQRLQPKRIVVLGGTGVISDAVMAALASYAVGP